MNNWKDDFSDGLRIMDGHGLTEGFGHLSMRLKDGTIAITPAMGPGMAAEEGLHVIFTLDGERLDSTGLPAPLESPMHLAIYGSRKEVGSICRTHSPFAVSFGVRGTELRTRHGFGLMLGRSVPFCEFCDLVSDGGKAHLVAQAIGSCRGLFLKGNGSLVVGESIAQAVVRAIYLEEAARIAVQSGKFNILEWSAEEVATRSDWHAAEEARSWDYYRWRYCSQ